MVKAVTPLGVLIAGLGLGTLAFSIVYYYYSGYGLSAAVGGSVGAVSGLVGQLLLRRRKEKRP